MSDIKISVETAETPQVEGEITIVRVDGVIDTMTAHELEKVANSLLAQKRFRIIIDLGGVDYISSAGWGIFISNIREIRLNNGDIKLARMIPNVYEIFELLEFDSILRAFDNIEKAKADFMGGIQSAGKITEFADAKGAGSSEKAIKTNKPSISMIEPSSPKPAETAAKIKGAEKPGTQDQSAAMSNSSKRAIPRSARKLDEAILDLVGKDPFLSVGEIRREIIKDFPGTGFFKVWLMLRKLGLSSKKKRFYFARTRNFSS